MVIWLSVAKSSILWVTDRAVHTPTTMYEMPESLAMKIPEAGYTASHIYRTGVDLHHFGVWDIEKAGEPG